MDGSNSLNNGTDKQAARGKSDLGIRFLSAAVLAPVVLGLVWYGGWAFAALAAIAAAILVAEWSGVSRGQYGGGAVIVGALGAALAVMAFAGGYFAVAGGLLVAAALFGQILAWRSDPSRLFAIGVVYSGLPAISLVAFRSDPQFGLVVIIWLLVVVWASDIGAYLCGRTFGGPKLAPRVSPNKTWSGAVGGIVASVAAGVLIGWFASVGNLVPVAALAALLSVISQGGDLFESGFKRRFGVKDSSRLIPGHGGLLDRVDGLVAAALAAGMIGIARGGVEAAGTGVLLW